MHTSNTNVSPAKTLQRQSYSGDFGVSPPLTIAIPTYNRCQSVTKLVHQLIPQLLPEDELLVVNDGSQDGTTEALHRIPEVTLVSNPSNYGMVKTWNRCLTAASQDWICVIHDDDSVGPTALQTIRRACTLVDEPALIAHQSLDSHLDHAFRYRLAEPGAWAVLHTTTTPSGVTLHRDIVKAIGTFDEQFSYSCDLEYLARICAHYPSLVIENPEILHYNQHDQNYQYKTWRQADFWQQLEAIERTILSYANLEADSERYFRDRMTNYAQHMLKTASQAEDKTLLRHVGSVLWKQRYLGRRVRLAAGFAAALNTYVEL
jgi:glycosyltransferase involved in cell wall biosynthesis